MNLWSVERDHQDVDQAKRSTRHDFETEWAVNRSTSWAYQKTEWARSQSNDNKHSEKKLSLDYERKYWVSKRSSKKQSILSLMIFFLVNSLSLLSLKLLQNKILSHELLLRIFLNESHSSYSTAIITSFTSFWTHLFSSIKMLNQHETAEESRLMTSLKQMQITFILKISVLSMWYLD